MGVGNVRGKEQGQMGHYRERINEIGGLHVGSKTKTGLLGDPRWHVQGRPQRKYILAYG